MLDVSDDLTRGSVQSSENDISKVSLTLANHRRKYDRVFTPNDRITIQMKRISWVQVFAGYLDEVPFFSVFPREVPLSASCTLKRLVYRPWDPGSVAAINLLNTTSSITDVDGGVRDKMFALLTDVAEWPAANIHIGALPSAWYDKAKAIGEALASRVTLTLDDLGLGNITSGSTGVVTNGTLTLPSAGRFTGVLPNSSGKISWFGGSGGGAYGGMQLTGESGITPTDPWYCAMRWPYMGYVNGSIKSLGTAAEKKAAMDWWRNRKLLVVHTTSGKAVVVRAADWGPGGVPSADSRVIDVSKTALTALGAKTDDVVEIRFAADAAALGPVSAANATTSGAGGAVHPIAPQSSPVTGQTGMIAGLSFTAQDSLQPNVAAARQFIKQTWTEAQKNSIGGFQKRNIAGTGTPSDHSFGLALDVGNGSGNNRPNAEQLAYGTSVASWFCSNPQAFGVKYVIWNNQMNTGKGWKVYHGGTYANNMSLGHFNHVHISFHDTRQTAIGPMGSPWPGAEMPGFPSFTPAIGGALGGSAAGGNNLVNAWNWNQQPDPLSNMLFGPRALMNDSSLIESLRGLVTSSMRSFMAGPNGDFISWFPDYFGTYKTAGIMNIKDIELLGDGFSIQWSDARLKTHIFATGSTNGFGALGGAVDTVAQSLTSGIASVEYPEIMAGLLNMDPARVAGTVFADPKVILDRFGARPESMNIPFITGAASEFWYALSSFQRNWVSQFSSRIELAFMPEVFPGMLLRLETYKFQAYVTAVTHSFDFSDGGGFTTSVSVMAPSATDGSGLIGLGKAG